MRRKTVSELSDVGDAAVNNWLLYFSRYISMHGFAWYDRVPNRTTKLILLLGFLTAFVLLPLHLVSLSCLFNPHMDHAASNILYY